MSNAVIEVEHLSKLYELGTIGSRTLRESLERWWYGIRGKEHLLRKVGAKHQTMPADHPQAGPRPNTMWALKDVSFTVREGEVLGIIGRNGAGKSTLLKLLTRITEPTSGRALIYGRVASLLEVGTGFHPELTGRENIYLNGAILGMTRTEVKRKFDEIVAFSEVEQFIDTPVKRYSSGMYVRLAFAVAAHLDPEILVVDEVLAVGDAEFQKKCLGKMGDVAKGGRTVLFVSHNMASIGNLCGSVIHLDHGRIADIGESESVISSYLSLSREANQFFANPSERKGDHRVRIDDFGISPPHPRTGSPLKCTLDIQADERAAEDITVDFSISFVTEYGVKIFQLHSGHVNRGIAVKPGRSRIIAEIDSLPLTPGSYRVNLFSGSGGVLYDWIPEAYALIVETGSISDGIYVDNRGYPVVIRSKWSRTPD